MVGPKALGNKKIKIKKGKKMAKFSTISKAASAAILGAVLLVGCGSSDTTAAGSSLNSGDGYLGGLGRVVNGTTTQDGVKFHGNNKGKFTMNSTKANGKKITIKPQGLYFDLDQSGDYNSTVDVNLTFELKADGAAGFVSHLTTLAVDTNDSDLAALVNNFDPIEAASVLVTGTTAEKNKAGKLLVLGEAVKTILKTDSAQLSNLDVNTSVLEDVNATSANLDMTTAMATVATNNPSLGLAVDAKINSVKAVIAVIQDMNSTGTVDAAAIEEMFSRVSDGDQNVSEAIANVGGTAFADINTTLIDNADSNVSTSNTLVDNLPAKLVIPSTITVGEETFNVNDGVFEGNIISADGNISAFCDISLGNVVATKAITATDANITVTIDGTGDYSGDQVSLSIIGAKISASENGAVTVTIPQGTTIKATQAGLPALQSVIGTMATATTTKELTNTDFGFNVSTLLGALDNSNIQTAISTLSTYLAKSAAYEVSIKLDTELYADYKTITGAVNVNMTDTAIKAANQVIVDAIKVGSELSMAASHVEMYETLPTTINGATITWASNNSAIATDGTVTKPAVGAANATGTLVATITKGTGATLATATFTSDSITVEAEQPAAVTYDNTVATGDVNSYASLATQGNETIKFNDPSSALTGNAATIYITVNGGSIEASVTTTTDMTGTFIYTNASGTSYTSDFATAITAGTVDLTN